jgi:hypothetical protein
MKFIGLTADDSVPGSGLLKRFTGKVAGIIVTGHEEGASMAISNLFMTLTHYGMIFPPFSNVYAVSSVCNPTYADKPIITSKCYKTEAKLLAKNIVGAAKLAADKKGVWRYEESAD